MALAWGAFSAAWLSGSITAIAQEEPKASEKRYETVVVTATKRESDPQDLGLVVTALSGEEVRERRLDSVSDLAASLANVELYEPTGGGVPTIIIRGVGLQDFRINNSPTASFYVDEIYQPTVATTNQGLFDLERIEVLKGPQGGLYGRNTTGGAIQIVSARPDTDAFSGYGTFTVGSFGSRELESAVNVPVSSDLAVRFAGRHVESEEGYTFNAVTGNEHGAQDRWSGRIGALWTPTDNVEIYANFHAGEDQSETPLLRTIGTWAPGSTFVPGAIGDGVLLNYGGIAPGTGALCSALNAGRLDNATCATALGTTPDDLGNDPYASLSSDLNRLDNAWAGATLIATVDLSGATLTSVTGYDTLDYGRLTDWDALGPALEDVLYNSEIDSFTQELRLAWSAGSTDWIAGVNAAKDTLSENSVLLADLGLVPVGFGVNEVNQRYEQETESWAVFGRGDIPISEQVKLVTELRYSSETKSFAGRNSLPQVPVDLFTVDLNKDFSNVSGRLSLEYAPTENLLWYASVSRGFKSGGFFGGFATSASELEPYDPETLTALEAGIKSQWADGRFTANGSVFHYQYTDLQGFANTTSASGAQINLLSNVGDAEVNGADIDFTWLPLDDAMMRLSIGLLDGEITDSDRTMPDSLAVAQNWPLQGQRLLNQSDVSLDAFGRYAFDVTENLQATIQAGYSYRSEFNFDFVLIPQEAPLYTEDGYGLATFRAGIGPADGAWEFSVFLDNAFDELYRTTARADDLGGFYELYGPPQTWGAALAVRW
jgi:iron complex outermembrane receptor protein